MEMPAFSVRILSWFMLWRFQGDLQMVISGANYRSDSWTLSLFNLIAALKRCLADWSVTVTGKECLRGSLTLSAWLLICIKQQGIKERQGKKKNKNNPEAFHTAVPAFRVTGEMKLFKFLSPSSACSPSISDCVYDGALYRSVRLSLRLPTGLCPEKFSDRWVTVLLFRAFWEINHQLLSNPRWCGASGKKVSNWHSLQRERSQESALCFLTWIMHLRIKEAWKSNT